MPPGGERRYRQGPVDANEVGVLVLSVGAPAVMIPLPHLWARRDRPAREVRGQKKRTPAAEIATSAETSPSAGQCVEGPVSNKTRDASCSSADRRLGTASSRSPRHPGIIFFLGYSKLAGRRGRSAVVMTGLVPYDRDSTAPASPETAARPMRRRTFLGGPPPPSALPYAVGVPRGHGSHKGPSTRCAAT